MQDLGRSNVGVRGHGSDHNLVARLPNVIQAGNAPEVAHDRRSRSGFSGMSMCLMPSGDRASHTAFTMQGVEAIVPASPTPFTPIGFTGVGVTVRSSVKSGRRCALGSA